MFARVKGISWLHAREIPFLFRENKFADKEKCCNFAPRIKKQSNNRVVRLIKQRTIMKTSTFKTMMITGMMILGTMTTFAKTNANVHHDRNHGTRTEVVVVTSNHHSMIDRHMRPGMERSFFINHMMEGRHYFGHSHECKVCHLTKREIREVEKDMRHNHHVPVTRPNHFRR